MIQSKTWAKGGSEGDGCTHVRRFERQERGRGERVREMAGASERGGGKI